MDWTEISHLGLVSTEGGPILIVDKEGASAWRGATGDGGDYERAIEVFDTNPHLHAAKTSVGAYSAFTWDVPTGTISVWRVAQDSLLMEWGSDATEAPHAEHGAPRSQAILGELEVRSGWIVIAWSAEPLDEVQGITPTDGLSLALSVGQAALVVKLPVGEYEAIQLDDRDNDTPRGQALLIRSRHFEGRPVDPPGPHWS